MPAFRLTNPPGAGTLSSYAGMAELADAPDLGSGTSGVQVRPLLPAPRRRKLCIACGDFFKSPARSLRCGSFFPRNFAGANFRGDPGRPPAGPWTALHSKSPADWPGFSHTTPSFHLGPRTAACAAVGLETRLRAQSFSPQNFATQTFVGTPAIEARWQAQQWNIGIISAITSATATFIVFSSYRSFVFILSSSSFSCFSD